MVKLLWVGIVIGLVFSNWVDGFEELRLNGTAMSLFEAEAYGVSKAAIVPNALMVGLTLIHGAGAKVAGTFFFYYHCKFSFFLPFFEKKNKIILFYFNFYCFCDFLLFFFLYINTSVVRLN
jgi:hypothetical protein